MAEPIKTIGGKIIPTPWAPTAEDIEREIYQTPEPCLPSASALGLTNDEYRGYVAAMAANEPPREEQAVIPVKAAPSLNLAGLAGFRVKGRRRY